MSGSTREERARARAQWPVRRVDIADAADSSDVMTTGTPAERFAMVWALTLDAWAMRGDAIPDYPRNAAPGRLLRPRSS